MIHVQARHQIIELLLSNGVSEHLTIDEGLGLLERMTAKHLSRGYYITVTKYLEKLLFKKSTNKHGIQISDKLLSVLIRWDCRYLAYWPTTLRAQSFSQILKLAETKEIVRVSAQNLAQMMAAMCKQPGSEMVVGSLFRFDQFQQALITRVTVPYVVRSGRSGTEVLAIEALARSFGQRSGLDAITEYFCRKSNVTAIGSAIPMLVYHVARCGHFGGVNRLIRRVAPARQSQLSSESKSHHELVGAALWGAVDYCQQSIAKMLVAAYLKPCSKVDVTAICALPCPTKPTSPNAVSLLHMCAWRGLHSVLLDLLNLTDKTPLESLGPGGMKLQCYAIGNGHVHLAAELSKLQDSGVPVTVPTKTNYNVLQPYPVEKARRSAVVATCDDLTDIIGSSEPDAKLAALLMLREQCQKTLQLSMTTTSPGASVYVRVARPTDNPKTILTCVKAPLRECVEQLLVAEIFDTLRADVPVNGTWEPAVLISTAEHGATVRFEGGSLGRQLSVVRWSEIRKRLDKSITHPVHSDAITPYFVKLACLRPTPGLLRICAMFASDSCFRSACKDANLLAVAIRCDDEEVACQIVTRAWLLQMNLDAPIDVISNDIGLSPLASAIALGKMSVVSCLLEHGATPPQRCDLDRERLRRDAADVRSSWQQLRQFVGCQIRLPARPCSGFPVHLIKEVTVADTGTIVQESFQGRKGKRFSNKFVDADLMYMFMRASNANMLNRINVTASWVMAVTGVLRYRNLCGLIWTYVSGNPARMFSGRKARVPHLFKVCIGPVERVRISLHCRLASWSPEQLESNRNECAPLTFPSRIYPQLPVTTDNANDQQHRDMMFNMLLLMGDESELVALNGNTVSTVTDLNFLVKHEPLPHHYEFYRHKADHRATSKWVPAAEIMRVNRTRKDGWRLLCRNGRCRQMIKGW